MHKLNKPEHPAIPSSPVEVPPIAPVSETELRQQINAATRCELQPVLATVALTYLGAALSLSLHPDSAVRQPLFASSVAVVGSAVVAWILLRFEIVSSAWSHAVGAAVVFLILGNIWLQFVFDRSPLITTQLILCLVVVGYLFRLIKWYLPLTLASIALWCGFAIASNFSGLWPQFGAAIVLTVILAASIHRNSSSMQRELYRLRLEEGPQRAHLTRIAEQANDDDKRFRALWDLGYDALLLHDQGMILDANEALCNLLGYSRSELIGAHFSIYLAAESRAQFGDLAQFGNFQSAEAVGVRKNGVRMSLQLFNKQVPGDRGNISISALRDVTDHKRQEGLRLHETDRAKMGLREMELKVDLARRRIEDQDDEILRLKTTMAQFIGE
jgi:PAS domain S-box-containing protein